MARNDEPAFRRKTPLLICSIRTEIPYPCVGASANVFRMSMSSVPWTRSLGLSGINLLPLGYQGEHTLASTGCQEEWLISRTKYESGGYFLVADEFLTRAQSVHGISRSGAECGKSR